MNQTTKTADRVSPFQKAEVADRRLKLLLYGDSGVGKTTLALQFPHTVAIDMEGGTDLYGDVYSFDRLNASDANSVTQAIDWLRTENHTYKTLVIDPITILWESLQHKWSDIFLKRNKGGKGFKFEYYDFQMRDWGIIKNEWRDILRKLIALDMNVVVTARQKILYSDTGMRPIGMTFDGEKSLPYLFDVVVRLYRDEKGRFMGECIKDRSGRLPREPFPTDIALYNKCLFPAPASTPTASKPITSQEVRK